MKKSSSGFTVVELMVAVSIIAILTAVGVANFREGSAQSRDAERQADLRNIQSAIELYKNKNGRYPEGCRGPGVWSGQKGTNYACSSGSQYIVGLAPEFISSLPVDPRLNPNDANSGYVYTVNTDGTVYKLMAKNTVESETVDYNHPLKSCDATNSSIGICDATHPSNNRPSWCDPSNSQFRSSYGVWGGYAYVAPNNPIASTLIERWTEDILCDVQ